MVSAMRAPREIAVSPPMMPAAASADPSADPSAKRFSVVTLGCKVNHFESEWIAQTLQQNSADPTAAAPRYARVSHAQPADLCIVNTCTVTAEAARQARQYIRRAVRKNPSAWVVVTGCHAQIEAEACAAIPGVDLVVGNAQKMTIPMLLEKLYARRLPPIILDDVNRAANTLEAHAQDLPLPEGPRGRARASLQIQQGCDQGCTFCVIHTARGRNRSFSPGMLLRQARQLFAKGYHELVICGVDIGSYGLDISPHADDNLAELLRQICDLDGDFRVRLSSIDPAHLTDALLARIADEPKICPQLHLSLQSASTLILKRMKRRASREMVYERIAKLRGAVPELVLSADIMVGFPTETDAHFAHTLRAVTELEIAYPHVFTYSQRPGTPAARIPAQVPTPIAKQRAKLISEAGRAVWQRVAQRRIGARPRVLIEQRRDVPRGFVYARAADYFPVRFAAPRDAARGVAPSAWAAVEVTGVGADALLARRLD